MGRVETVLVLGGSGFLGAHLLSAAQEAFPGARVVSAGRRPRGAGEVAFDALEAGGPRSLEALLPVLRPDRIALATALSRVGDCEGDPGLAAALNTDLALRVASWCRRSGARLVHVSTDLVFGAVPPRGARYGEDDPPSPVHAYGRTKAAGEAAVLASGADALVVRLPLLFGDSGGRGLGASDQLRAALARGETPLLFRDEWRTPLDVGDAARAVVECLGRGERGILHVAGPERLSRLELALAVLAAEGVSPAEAAERIRAGERADLGLSDLRPADVSLDATRARSLLRTPLRAARKALA